MTKTFEAGDLITEVGGLGEEGAMSQQEKPDASGLYHNRVHKEGRGRAAKTIKTVKAEREKRTAVNLARGVPAFWAPWAMWSVPAEEALERGGFRLYHLVISTGALWLCRACVAGSDLPRPVVALSSEGPTLAPWGL